MPTVLDPEDIVASARQLTCSCSLCFVAIVQELIPQVESETRIFEQIHILAVAGLRNVDWNAITVSMPPLH